MNRFKLICMAVVLVCSVSAASAWTVDGDNADFNEGDLVDNVEADVDFNSDFEENFDWNGDFASSLRPRDFDPSKDFYQGADSDQSSIDYQNGNFAQPESFERTYDPSPGRDFEQYNKVMANDHANHDMGSAHQDKQSVELAHPPQEGEFVPDDEFAPVHQATDGDATQHDQPIQQDGSAQADLSIQTNAAQGDSLAQNIHIQNIQSLQKNEHDHHGGLSHGIWHGQHHAHHHDFDIGFGLGIGPGWGFSPFYPFTPFSGFDYYGYGGFAPYSNFGFHSSYASFGGIGFYSGYVPAGYAGLGPYGRFESYYPLGGFPAVVADAAFPIAMTSTPASKPTYIQQQNVSQPAAAIKTNYWHYCRKPEGYYPYVRKCPDGWVKIPPQPS
ncbi:hypothetical protein [Nitrosomonas communis]|uniref:Uncharacterized protein n=1 Tax=Nitrosomonas communis TaxID=44574 RepID=A0A1H2S782_9PROT|nr:hypothetical protein [Nitrosomonas communis]SDW26819.1 hypothetical protein SAMN05421882_100643 [Nitrosomonas communis]